MTQPSARLRFCKMHGAGNDFVIIDRRVDSAPLSEAFIRLLCDRRRGVGCDQLISIEPAHSAGAAFAYGIWNADGSRAQQCGNGARCVVAWARRDGIIGTGYSVVDSPSGPVQAIIADDGAISVDLGEPQFSPERIGLTLPESPSYALEVNDRRVEFFAVSLGNPHAVIRVPSTAAVDVSTAFALQHSGLFRDGCNVGLAEVIDRGEIRLRVIERGVGETLACGSGACAAVAALRRAGQLDADVAVDLPGGRLQIHWPGEGAAIRMSGPTRFVFEGEWLA